jgi:hypothetical protein
MRKSAIANAKLVVTVRSEKSDSWIQTVSVFDNRTQHYWSEEEIRKRGIERFLDVRDMKETLNWNLNGDEKKYRFMWGKTAGGISEGRAYISD